MLFFADSAEMKRSQAMLIGSGTTIVVVTLLAIHALDNPYRRRAREASARSRWSGRSRSSSEARSELDDEAPIPCDDEGNATTS